MSHVCGVCGRDPWSGGTPRNTAPVLRGFIHLEARHSGVKVQLAETSKSLLSVLKDVPLPEFDRDRFSEYRVKEEDDEVTVRIQQKGGSQHTWCALDTDCAQDLVDVSQVGLAL